MAGPGGGLGGLQSPVSSRIAEPRSCLDHTVTMCSVVMYRATGNKATQFVMVWSHYTPAEKIGQQFTWQKHMQLLWDWDTNHAPEGAARKVLVHMNKCLLLTILP